MAYLSQASVIQAVYCLLTLKSEGKEKSKKVGKIRENQQTHSLEMAMTFV